jgi:hypothetical protein
VVSEVRLAGNGQGAFSFDGLPQAPFALRPQEWCDITVSFVSSTEGRFEDSVIVETDDPQYREARITLKGEVFDCRDTNTDHCVNVVDLLTVRNNLGNSGAAITPAEADVDGDGTVNVVDLLMVRNRLGKGSRCQ